MTWAANILWCMTTMTLHSLAHRLVCSLYKEAKRDPHDVDLHFCAAFVLIA